FLFLLIVIIASLSQLGINTSSLVALIGAAGLAVGLALQNSLQNFAAGVMILIFKPFRKGDFIEAAGVSGVVEQIGLLVVE
ncbi:mechanosensitive ion channel, partial [Staphylococcus aureus]